jgi:cell cycle sensor histidine kinase DivJ
VNFVAPVRAYIDSLVHPSVRWDVAVAARHRAFIAPRLFVSLAATAALPIYLALKGPPSTFEALVFAGLIAPILIVSFLSRTGRYESAYALSSFTLAGLLTVIALGSGGISSFAMIWLLFVPLEATLSASRRVVTFALAFAVCAAGVVLMLDGLGHAPAAVPLAQERIALAALGIVAASIYAAGLAFGVVPAAHTGYLLQNPDEDRYRLLACNMTDVIVRHGRNGVVRFISPAAEPMLGLKPQDLLKHGLFERVHVADRPAYLTALSDAASVGDSRSVEFRVRRSVTDSAASQFVWVEMRCRALDPAAGDEDDERGVVAVLRDITVRKEQEATLEEARAEAERANTAKGLFLATVSHELRTPLNAIIGFSEMLTNEEALMIDAKRRLDYARLINESGHHLLSVVNDILDMSKIESGNFEIVPEPFAPQGVIAECCQLLGHKAREMGIDLVVDLPDSMPNLIADKRSLHQIMLNLVSNAIKFTKRGGKVTVSARADASSLVVVVDDNGVGIGVEDLPRIGSPFFQARSSYDRRHDGTGLGLSIVKGLLDLHGGEMDVASRLGEGTCVTVRLPLDCEAVRKRSKIVPLSRQADGTEDANIDEQVRISA